MAKKENQWLIDRAFNFDCSNESKIKSVLKNIYRYQNRECSYNDAVNAIVSEGGTPSFERYERSTQTLFKSYGLELSKDEILPISIAFVEGIINFKELALLQCFKKQYMDNRSHIIRPLIITLSFLYKAYENHITKEYAWIDAYDYMTYLTEVTNYSDIDSVFDAFITDKSLSVEDRHIDEVKDCDIWYNFFVTTGLFCKDEEVKYKLYMNLDELDLIKYLLNYHINASYINPGENWLVNFGSLNIGLSEILPTLNTKCNNVSIDIDDSIVNEVLYYTLVEGLSANECDDVVLEKLGHNFLTKGLVTSYILNKFSIPNSYENNLRGVFRPFKNYLGILNFSKEYHEVKNIIERITGIKQKHKLLSVERKIGGSNMIYYGTPGCGKSYLVDEIYNKPNNKVYRTVFHPEYSNSDFVGQIMPRVNKSDNKFVIYEFIPGIFTQALKFAVNNPNVSVYLIIEEINRGNASAIFGEIFQLLDRNTDGTSIYSVKNSNIAEQLGEFEDFDIKIPSNLSLIATMNTSDQNVYTLDTAFKRRWDLIKIRNTFDDVKGEHKVPENLKYKHYLGNLYVPGTDITWLKFVESINAKISSKGKTFTIVSEDKELGVYFVTPKYLSLNKNDNTNDLVKMFAEKVLMYLWNDIAKTDPDKWFVFEEGQAKTLDNLLKNFEKNALNNALNVFAQGIFSKIQNSVIGE